MRLKRAITVAATFAAAATCTSAPPALGSPHVLEGETATGTAVRLTLGGFGNATRFRIASHDLPCEAGTMSQKAIRFGRLDRSDPGSFRDNARLSFKAGAIRFKTSVRVRGQLGSDGRAWHGTYRAVTKLFEDGAHIDTCRLRTTWRAG